MKNKSFPIGTLVKLWQPNPFSLSKKLYLNGVYKEKKDYYFTGIVNEISFGTIGVVITKNFHGLFGKSTSAHIVLFENQLYLVEMPYLVKFI